MNVPERFTSKRVGPNTWATVDNTTGYMVEVFTAERWAQFCADWNNEHANN